MRVEVVPRAAETVATPLMAVLVAADRPLAGLEALDRAVGGVLGRAVRAGDFEGREGDWVLGYGNGREEPAPAATRTREGPDRVLFLGVGESASLTPEDLRRAGGSAVRAAGDHRVSSLALCPEHLGEAADSSRVQAAVEGLVLAAWRFAELRSREGGGVSAKAGERTPPPMEAATLVGGRAAEWEEPVRIGQAFAEGENLARTLQARPGNVATPSHLAAEAERIAAASGLECEILGPAEMEAQRMGALLSVARGSREEPRLIVLRHRGGETGAAPLVLVGKGLTFDAGGISLKPAKGMEDMKYDMSGGAAVLGAMLAVGRLGLPVNVTAVVPSSENLPGGSATKPGDVVRSRAGKTIEVINTDAEGRLILADALHYAAEWDPAAIVDCATLTGACVIALGHHRSALLGNDDDLMEELRAAGDRAAEPCWPLPLDGEYRKQLKSDFADLRNVGGRPAGTITAACFLSEFVGSASWAHLDIAGTAYGKTKKPYLRNGPAGVPCRLLLEWVRTRAGL